MLKKTIITLVLSSALILLIVSSVAITADAPELTPSTTDGKVHQWKGPVPKGVVWDNGMQYDNGGASQDDPISGLDPILADDFQFATDQLVNDVHWIGGYWGGPPDDGNFDWRVIFYNDFGDGTKPGAAIATYLFPNANVNETLILGDYYSYSVDLPATLTFLAGTKYWISIQGIGAYPPQSGWAMHSDQILLHEAVFKSVYFGYPNWTNSSAVFGIPYYMCFQLTYKGPWPNHKMHFPQLPDLEGWDVLATFPKTLADDWQCSATGLVTDIHFWGSWKDIDGNPSTDDFYTPMPMFRLSIHRNIPADADTPWSRPGELVWEWYGEIPGTPFEPPAMEHWYDPNTGDYFCNDHVPYWRYDFVGIPTPFFQHEDSIYWLDITAMGIPTPYQWGWKTSRDHFMDDAVYTDTPPVGPWIEMYEPPRCNRFNVYFNSMGFPTDSGSTNYYGEGWYRYEYWSNIWFYDNPFTYERPKHIWLQFNINQAGPMPTAQFAINWSTPAWDSLEMGRPPLPGENEMLYIGRQVFPVHPGPNTIDYSLSYNPEWVSIDFVATDVLINGWIWHECVQTSMDLAFVITGEEAPPCDPPTIGCPADETQNQNSVYTTTTQWTADDGNPTDLSVELVSVQVQPPLPPGISAANVNFLGPIPGPGLGVKSTFGTVTYTVNDHCQIGGPITLIATNNCPSPNNTATCTFNVALTNDPPRITQPDSLEGFVNSTVQYDISGNDPNGDVINDAASIQIVPSCGTYSITRTSGSGTPSGTWQISWQTGGCTAGTYLVIHDLTDICQATSYCTTKVHLSEMTGWYWKPPYPDYAPNGMPDIDQKQDAWGKATTEQFTFCGPVAVANCFKWFDSKYNVPPGFPGDGMDQFPLVRQYIDMIGGMISPWDDHDPWNVDHSGTPWLFGATPPPPPTLPQPFMPGPQPPGPMPPWGELVERLAWYLNTDNVRIGPYCQFSGTNVMQMQMGIDMWLRSESFQNGSTLADTLCEVTLKAPTFATVESLVEKSEDVILLLGFWFEDPPGSGQWFRCGGHYVTVAGVNSLLGRIAFSDPFVDAVELGWSVRGGRVGDGMIIPHQHGSHDPVVHNDEGNVSHDIYIAAYSQSPGGVWGLPEYPVFMDPMMWSSNFFNQNVPDEFVPMTAPWNQVSPIYTDVEYAVHISPWDYRGDVNGDGKVNVNDVVYLINYLFVAGSPPPVPTKWEGDVNCDGKVDVTDVVYLINYLFVVGSPAPCRVCDP